MVDLSDDMKMFFRNPLTWAAPSSKTETYGVLYLLRRDVYRCFGIDPDGGPPKQSMRSLWPGTLTIMAGIDLLGRFAIIPAGVAEPGSKARFNNYVRSYVPGIVTTDSASKPSDQKLLYSLRCALVHSFGWSDGDPSTGTMSQFRMNMKTGPLIDGPATDGTFTVSAEELRQRFEQSIAHYIAQLQVDANADLRNRFEQVFPEYGKTHIQWPVVSGVIDTTSDGVSGNV